MIIYSEKNALTRIIKIFTLLLIAQFLFEGQLLAAQKQSDVRIIVDVSGSMKRNDPKNLRIPAVRLVTGILPQNSKAGLWLFAEKVEKLSNARKVTSSTKKEFNQLAAKIHNRGLYTDIGSALESATADWKEDDNSTQRIVILLTDGVVDISKDKTINIAERKRIQQQLFPQLKKLNARIYTVALSDEADGELLAQLSNSTDAWFEAVKTAEQLEKVFLKIFEQSVTVPTLPLNNNKFKVDQSIEEFTALIFRSSLEPISLISPNGIVYEADTISAKLSWFEEKKFDLITFRKPQAGEWKIEGPVDPSNRVMVVSDLTLDVNNDELPTSLFAGNSIDIKVSLQEKGKIIDRASFLKLIHFSGEVDTTSSEIDDELILEDDGEHGDAKKSDGIFGYHFTAPKVDEEVTFELQVTSPTFERVYRRSMRIFSSYVKYQTTIAESIGESHKIEIKPSATVVEVKSLAVDGILKMPDGSELALEFKLNDSKNFQTEIVADTKGGIYTAILNIQGETLAGKQFSLKDETITFEAPAFESEQAANVETETENKPDSVSDEMVTDETIPKDAENDTAVVKEKPLESKDQAAIQPSAESDETGLSSFWWIIIGIIFNIIIFVGGFFIWKKWKKKQVDDGDDLANALDEEITDGNAEQEKPE